MLYFYLNPRKAVPAHALRLISRPRNELQRVHLDLPRYLPRDLNLKRYALSPFSPHESSFASSPLLPQHASSAAPSLHAPSSDPHCTITLRIILVA
jgi:hypothetical protein